MWILSVLVNQVYQVCVNCSTNQTTGNEINTQSTAEALNSYKNHFKCRKDMKEGTKICNSFSILGLVTIYFKVELTPGREIYFHSHSHLPKLSSRSFVQFPFETKLTRSCFFSTKVNDIFYLQNKESDGIFQFDCPSKSIFIICLLK